MRQPLSHFHQLPLLPLRLVDPRFLRGYWSVLRLLILPLAVLYRLVVSLFVPGFSPMVSVNHVLTFLPVSFFKISNDREVVDAVEQVLQSFEDVDYLSLIHI